MEQAGVKNIYNLFSVLLLGTAGDNSNVNMLQLQKSSGLHRRGKEVDAAKRFFGNQSTKKEDLVDKKNGKMKAWIHLVKNKAVKIKKG